MCSDTGFQFYCCKLWHLFCRYRFTLYVYLWNAFFSCKIVLPLEVLKSLQFLECFRYLSKDCIISSSSLLILQVSRLPTAVLTFLPCPVSNFLHVSHSTVLILCVTVYPSFFCWILLDALPFFLSFYLFCHGFRESRSASFETCLGLLGGVRMRYFQTEALVYISLNYRLEMFGSF